MYLHFVKTYENIILPYFPDELDCKDFLSFVLFYDLLTNTQEYLSHDGTRR